jgi:UDP-N-acetylglucosamine:LPS N-acetylglucosamine transferase
MATFVIHHAGMGIMQDSMAAAKPAIMVPYTAEQKKNAWLARKKGLGAIADTTNAATLEKTIFAFFAGLLRRPYPNIKESDMAIRLTEIERLMTDAIRSRPMS